MKLWLLAVLFTYSFFSTAVAQTPYGSCPRTAQQYQDAYESSMRAEDLVCYQKALEREMSGSSPYSCPLSAQHYQDEYTRTIDSSDLVCYQKALERELQ